MSEAGNRITRLDTLADIRATLVRLETQMDQTTVEIAAIRDRLSGMPSAWQMIIAIVSRPQLPHLCGNALAVRRDSCIAVFHGVIMQRTYAAEKLNHFQ